MAKYAYGQQPSDLGEKDLSLGWLSGVRHLRMNAAGESFWHSHREMQLLYCIKGEFGYEFGDGSAETLTAGHWIVIPARLKHRHVQAIDPAGHRVEMLAKVPRIPQARRSRRTRREKPLARRARAREDARLARIPGVRRGGRRGRAQGKAGGAADGRGDGVAQGALR